MRSSPLVAYLGFVNMDSVDEVLKERDSQQAPSDANGRSSLPPLRRQAAKPSEMEFRDSRRGACSEAVAAERLRGAKRGGRSTGGGDAGLRRALQMTSATCCQPGSLRSSRLAAVRDEPCSLAGY